MGEEITEEQRKAVRGEGNNKRHIYSNRSLNGSQMLIAKDNATTPMSKQKGSPMGNNELFIRNGSQLSDYKQDEAHDTGFDLASPASGMLHQ